MLKAVARLLFEFTVRLRRRRLRRQGEFRWSLGGDCRRCAACCERPSIQVDSYTWKIELIRRAFLAWQRVVNGFELVKLEEPQVFVFRCRYFDTRTRACTSYDSRPGICRDYPRFNLEQAWPEFLPGCGYRAVANNAQGLLVALNAADLPPDKREELQRRLRLK